MSLLQLTAEAVQLLPLDDLTPYLPDEDPGGMGPLKRVGSKIGGILLVIGMIGSMVWILYSLARAGFSERHRISDAKQPVIVFLLLAGFSFFAQTIWGVFNGIVS